MKITCKMQRACLTESLLSSLLLDWLEQLQGRQYDFRVSIRRVVAADAPLKQNSIHYLLLRKFAWMVTDLQDQTVLTLNLQLKSLYQKLVIGCFFKDATTFELLMLYLVRLTTHFLTDCFHNFQSDQALEAELFVILYYTFLGLEISAKTYEVMSRKYTTTRTLHLHVDTPQSNTPDDKSFHESKKGEFDSLSKTSKETKLFRFSRGTDPLRYSRQSFCKWGETPHRGPLAEFTTLLKENLHVAPLPPLKRKKVKAQELQRINTEPVEMIQHSPSPNRSGEWSVLKKKQIMSNQLSQSIKTLHPKSLLFELSSKSTKLHQSFYTPHHQHIQQDPLPQPHPKMREVDVLAKAGSPKPKCDDWTAIVQQLKRKVIDLKGKDHEAQGRRRLGRNSSANAISEESSVSNTQYYINAPKATMKEESVHEHRMEKESDSECAPSLLKFRDFEESFSIHTYQEGSGVPPSPSLAILGKKRKLTKNSLRIDKHSFANNCHTRKSQLSEANHINLHAEWIINHYKE